MIDRAAWRVVAPTAGLAILLVAMLVALAVRVEFAAEALFILTVAAVGAVAAVAWAWRVGHSFQRSFAGVARAVEAAAARLGKELPAGTANPNGVTRQLERLVEAIDRILDESHQREREVLRADQLAMVGQIAAGVAHELRNPLTSVKLLVQTNLREATRLGFPSDDLEVIEQETRRMERTLQRFLDFARPQKPERRPVSLTPLVDQTFALVEGRARRQQVRLEFERPAVPIVAEADEDQIRQLLVNLVLNALDAMPEGGRIEVRLERSDGDAELRVLDSGPGIPEDLFPTLFEPFVSTKETGIGLGLAVSYRIATGHGGMLSAVNRPEGGACFLLRLPVSSPPA